MECSNHQVTDSTAHGIMAVDSQTSHRRAAGRRRIVNQVNYCDEFIIGQYYTDIETPTDENLPSHHQTQLSYGSLTNPMGKIRDHLRTSLLCACTYAYGQPEIKHISVKTILQIGCCQAIVST